MRLTLCFVAFFTSIICFADDWGEFSGGPDTRWLSDQRSMELLDDFSYIGPDSVVWLAPKGSVVDGASIPQVAWSIIGGPFEGAYRRASVIHDVACDEKIRPWKDVHRAFYTAMRAEGVNVIKAKIMYGAVYHFGPRWGVNAVYQYDSIPEGDLGIKMQALSREAGPGNEVVLVKAGKRIESRVGFFGLQTRTDINGAIIEVRAVQPKLQETAFDKMKASIIDGDLSLDEIEALAVE